MNKASLKIFAVDARNELMEKMRTRLEILGITKNGIEKAKVVGKEVEVRGALYPKESYNSLIRKYRQVGYEELVEESAYTWFNRLTALAFMEANEYIDEKMIFNIGSKNEPGIIDNYYEFEFFKNLDVDLQRELHDLKDKNTANSIEKLYSILIEEKCEELSSIMPFMFKKKGTYSDILFPTGLLMENSLLVRLREEIGKEAPIELIGWLYQYYNSEKRAVVYDGSMKKEKINKEYIAPATQLFTPDWIVKYMVENSLGKLALESTGVNESLKNNWKYYIDSELDKNSEKIKIEDMKILDPAMGSGHILVYAFDILFEIYENLGWSTKDTVLSILKNNLYGLEIDERAGQLASFALMMKAREKFSRLFSVLKREEAFKLNTLVIEESNTLSEKIRNKVKDNNLTNINKVIEEFEDAKEYGSILKLENIDKEILEKEFNLLKESLNNNEQETLVFNEDELNISIEEDLELIESLIVQYIALTNQYKVVITNPPYMGNSRMNGVLKKYIDKNYSDVKNDLFAVFFIKCTEITREKGYLAFMSPFVWMFIKSYEELRKIFIEKKTISSLVQLEYSGFEDATVPICTFVLQNSYIEKKGEYIKLSDFKGAKNQPIKTLEAVKNPNCAWRFQAKQKDFEKIPGSPIAYWVSDKIREIFEKNRIDEFFDVRSGIMTGDDETYLKLWQEVNLSKIGFNYQQSSDIIINKKRWFPLNKGGNFRKWYGNNEYIIDLENNGERIRKSGKNFRLREDSFYFKEGMTWSEVSSSKASFRFSNNGILFGSTGPMAYENSKNKIKILSIIGLLNTKGYQYILNIMNPTLHYNVGIIGSTPLDFDRIFFYEQYIEKITNANFNISKEEWDSRETSWDFEKLSLIDSKDLKSAYENYCSHWRDNFVQLHKNEEELNRLFIEIYDLQDEMDEKVSFNDITILKKEAKIVEIDNSLPKNFSSDSEKYLYDRGISLEFNKDELVKQFLSYAVGCIMGRYSTNKSGLIMANSDDVLELSSNKFLVKDSTGELRYEVETKFLPDEFGILPFIDDKDFSNVFIRVKEFVKFVYGEESLKDNLNFIAEALGNKDNKNPEEIIRGYFIKDFYKDHLQRYQNRPIYWLMNSGKKNAFSCLFYMHRYEPLTIARVRADYLIPYQQRLENSKKFIERQLYDEDITAKEKKNVEKELKDLDVLLKELRDYANEVKHIAEQKIPLDLDDGVNVNYEKLEAILKKR